MEPGKNYYRSAANEGNFIGLVKLMAGENLALAKHIKYCQDYSKSGRRNPITFLSKTFINSTLFSIREYLVKVIVNEIDRNGGCFGLLMDGSQDISTKEQISVVVRYMNDSNDIVEHTVAFFSAKDTSGEALYTSLRTALSDIGLSLSNIVGCSFDGAQNMRSAACGLNFHIKQNNSNCLYVWCLSHQFNLVVKVATGGSQLIKDILRIAEDSAKMLRGSYVKMNIWTEVAKEVPNFNSQRKLKLIGTTRWSSKQDAVASIISHEVNLFVLIKVLVRICSLDKLDGASLAKACDNFNSWVDYKNIIATYVLHKLFQLLVPTTIFLQKVDLNILEGIQSLRKCNERLDVSKKELDVYFEEAENFIKATNVLLSNDHEIRALDCECIVRIPTEKEKQEMICQLRIEFCDFIRSLQYENNEILKQFNHNDSIYNEMQILDPMHAASHLRTDDKSIPIRKLCEINNIDESVAEKELRVLIFDFMRYQKHPGYVSVLANTDSDDDSDSGEEELNFLIENESDIDETTADLQSSKIHVMYKTCYCFKCILKYIGDENERKEKFANIFKLYKYIAMIPSTQVKCERDFSKMKITKTRLRANLSDKSLENLMLISLESNMLEHINLDDIVDHIVAKSNTISLYLHT